jgi:hypothetical protein
MIEPNRRAVNALVWCLGGVLIGLTLSKYAARSGYDLGYAHAKENYAMHYKHQIKAFNQHRDRSCTKFWFGDDAKRLAEARRWMCQYTDRKGNLK